MEINLHVWLHNVPDATLLGALSKLSSQMEKLMIDLSTLQANVANEATVISSAIVLLQGLAAQIAALAPTQAAIDALAADVAAKTQALADAVVANTPAGP